MEIVVGFPGRENKWVSSVAWIFKCLQQWKLGMLNKATECAGNGLSPGNTKIECWL